LFNGTAVISEKHTFSKAMSEEYLPKRILLLLMAVYLVIGIFIINDFGIGLDHSQVVSRSELALRQYSFNYQGDPVSDYLSQGINQYYGTGFTSFFQLMENTFQPLLRTAETRVFYYWSFITFVASMYSIFLLSRRWVSEWAALGAAILYGTQPLFFGHSFINPKDIPGMAIFLITVTAGFWLADKLDVFDPEIINNKQGLRSLIRQDWQTLTPKRQTWLKRFGWLWGGLVALWVLRLPDVLIDLALRGIYEASPESWLGALFRRAAPNAGTIPPEDYIQRAQEMTQSALDSILMVLSVVAVGLYLWLFRQPQKQLWSRLSQLISNRPLRRLWKNAVGVHAIAEDKRYWLAAVLAGAIWGFAISVRATNITAGGMIGLYLLLKLRERSLLPLIVYTISAVVMCLLSWPYLWYFGLQGFLDGMTAFADYPFVGGRVWLRGVIPIEELPSTYIPHTMLIQFTEPLVILALVGIFLSLLYAWRKRLPRLDIFIILSWFFLPVLYTAVAHPTLYNNFRQFFFITPPLFVFAALMMDWIGKRIKHTGIVAALFIVMLLPGVVEIVRLHPYQYVYYNQFVGGTEGAAGQYELDYWSISYRELMEYVNEHTPENGRVMTRGANDIPQFYGRSDIHFESIKLDTTPEELAEFDFVIMTTNNRHQLEYLDMNIFPVIFEVYAGKTLLATVQETSP
jgi:hypothetical protein